jgi:putative ABC transport system ATP-binding protein
VIQLSAVTAHAAPYSVSSVSLELGAGLHALLGAPVDGVAVLLAVMAGWIRPRSGKVLVLGSAPALSRRQIAYVPLEPRLPPSLRVTEVLDLAARIRGESTEPAGRRLASLGIDPLADRWTHSLTLPEARAVLLAEAVTSRARVVLVDEPRMEMDPRAERALATVLRECAAGGRAVVLSTSSPRDATDLSSSLWVFSVGRLMGTAHATDATTILPAAANRMRVVANDARRLLGAVAAEPIFARVELDQEVLILTGTDPMTMAGAVARAALAVGVELHAMRLDSPELDGMRRALSDLAPASAGPRGLSEIPTAGAP